MSLAVSPVPSPFLPWHISQSSVHHFLARVRDSGVDFTGFCARAASTGMAAYDGFCGGGLGAGCWERTGNAKSKSAEKTGAILCTVNLLWDKERLQENCSTCA